MSLDPSWIIAVAVSMTAILTAIGLVVGIASKPFKTMREHLSGAVSEIKSETSAIRSDLADIKSHLRDHDEALRGIRSGQDVIVESLGEVLPKGAYRVLRTSTEQSKVVDIFGYMREGQDAKAQHG